MSNASVAVTRDDMVLVVDDATIERTSGTFDAIEPFSGIARAGRSYNFAGALLPEHMTQDWPEAREPGMRTTSRPQIHDGEVFAEWYSIVRSIDLARDNYLMISLGAHLGVPIVNAHKILQQYKPMPSHFIGVEADEHMSRLLQKNLVENKIDPTAVTLNQVIISDSNQPQLFMTCPEPTGLNRVFNDECVEDLCRVIQEKDIGDIVLDALVNRGTTDFAFDSRFEGFEGLVGRVELKMVSALRLAEIVGPHPRIDYLEVDVQGAEYVAIPPVMDLLTQQVSWVHLGTHEDESHHRAIRDMFKENGWDVHIDWLPFSRYETPQGRFVTSDGVLAMQNPKFQ